MTTFANDLTGASRDAAAALTSLFTSYGLGSLAPQIVGFLKQGYSSDTVSLLLQDTAAYKQRFAANAAREKAGLPVLSPAQYLATEQSYRQIMQQAGLPPGFYDQPSDFTKFLEQDISPAEIQSRVQAASTFVNSADQNALNYMKQYYTQGDLMAYALDPTRAAPLVGKAFDAAQVGGAAADQGLAVDKATADELASKGISAAQASQGFSLVASDLPNATRLSQIYGGGLSQQDLINETFLNDAGAAFKRQTLASKERANFGGSSGVNNGSLTTSTAGQL